MLTRPEHGAATDEKAKAHVRAVTVASGTSFYWAMRFLPRARREAMFAIYAFCREVDDIADDDGTPDDKRRRLDMWRDEIDSLFAGTPERLTARALVEPVRRFGMRREDFLAVIDGMKMDLGEGLKAPSFEELDLYCHRVAGRRRASFHQGLRRRRSARGDVCPLARFRAAIDEYPERPGRGRGPRPPLSAARATGRGGHRGRVAA